MPSSTTDSKQYVKVLSAVIWGDAYIRKYNSDGDEVWSRQFGTSRSDIAFGVSTDSSGGVYVVGLTDFGTFPDQTSEGGGTHF